MTRENVIDYLRLMSRYANLFELNISRNSRGSTVTLVHDLMKGSQFFGEYVKSALKGAGLDDDIEFDENSVTVELLDGAAVKE